MNIGKDVRIGEATEQLFMGAFCKNGGLFQVFPELLVA